VSERVKRAIVPGLAGIALYYAIFGGEYSIFELHATRAAVQAEGIALEELSVQIDSLRAWADSLENDPATIERIAREEFGMIREGETLYRFADGDPDLRSPEAEAPSR
jgi:cell division protein FtsB